MLNSEEFDAKEKSLDFQISGNETSIIKVIGIGGGGGNAVNYMFREGIKDVEFIICNTDSQALEKSPVDNKIQIGTKLTAGGGVGGNSELGEKAALEDIDKIRDALGLETKMLFITCGMGGGTGTGGAPVVAKLASEMDILTVGIVTVPFEFEGDSRMDVARKGVQELEKYVDALIIIKNQRLMEMFNGLSIKQAWGHADEVLATAAKGIAEIITVPGEMNVDFEDVKAIMKNSGTAILGSAVIEGEDRAYKAIEAAIESPLLKDNDIRGAQHILLNIVYGDKELEVEELNIITKYLKQVIGSTANTKLGLGEDKSMGNRISVTVVATSLSKVAEIREDENSIDPDHLISDNEEKVVFTLNEDISDTEGNVEKNEDKTADTNTSGPRRYDLFPKSGNEDKVVKSIKTSEGLRESETVPAFQRKGVRLENVPHSSENNISRYTLSTDENQKPKINEDNPYLDPKVD